MSDKSLLQEIHDRLNKVDTEIAVRALGNNLINRIHAALSAPSAIVETVRPVDIVNLGDRAAWLCINGQKTYIAPGDKHRAPLQVSDSPLPQATKLVAWFRGHYGTEGTYPGRGLVEELRLAIEASTDGKADSNG